MDPRDATVAMAVEAARLRREKRRMEELLRVSQAELRVKAMECEMLMRNKQDMVAKEADKQKVMDDFIIFIESIENNDPETAQTFDENSMMNTIRTIMIGTGGNASSAAGDNKKQA